MIDPENTQVRQSASSHIAPSRFLGSRMLFVFSRLLPNLQKLLRIQTALAAPSPVFFPYARTCSLHHRRGYISAREHAHTAKILGDHRGPWCNMRASFFVLLFTVIDGRQAVNPQVTTRILVVGNIVILAHFIHAFTRDLYIKKGGSPRLRVISVYAYAFQFLALLLCNCRHPIRGTHRLEQRDSGRQCLRLSLADQSPNIF